MNSEGTLFFVYSHHAPTRLHHRPPLNLCAAAVPDRCNIKLNYMKELLFIFAAAAGKAELVAALLKIKMDEQDFANILKAAHAGLLPLAKLVAKTKTKVDDTAVSIPLEAIEEVAKFKGIEL